MSLRIQEFATYANTPIKSCDNCAYQREGEYRPQCARTGYSCTGQRRFPDANCDHNFSGWIYRGPPPPRRSLRRWLADLFWN